ncbi:MAG: hypothetical protein ACOVJ6_06130 [Pirellulales bacterium]
MNRFAWIAILVGSLMAPGCKSDISQQLLERELRMQEDQIYVLQDEIQEKCARLDRVAAENRSLKKQLGIVDPDASLPNRIDVPAAVAAPARGPLPAAPPALVPPTISAPTIVAPPMTLPEPTGVPPVGADPAGDGPRFGPPAGGSAPPATIAPPTLDGVPPLPDEPSARGASAAPSGGPDIKRLSHEESLSAEGRITHLIINPARTACFDGDGDGTSDGVAIVFEPRDADERLVTAGGDVSIVAYDPATPGGPEGAPLAKWDVPSAEALAHFRRTSRARGLHFTLPWQGRPPAGDHVRVFVKLTSFDGQSFETDATVPVR